MAILDAYGKPIRTQELTREIAAPTLAGIRTIWTDTIAAGLTPGRLANLLRSAAEGDHTDYLTLAEEMEERDLHYACELGKRKLAVSRMPISVESFSDDKKDLELADAVRGLVRRPGFRGLAKDCLDALGKGYSVTEIIWDKSGQRWSPAAYKWRDPRFFQFDRVTMSEVRLRDEADMMDGVELAPYKFIVHVPKIKSGIPIRGGIARLAAWAWMCKGYTIKDWLAFAEVFGMPLRMGKYGSSASADDIAILKTAVANLGSDAAAVFPESMMIELVEAGKSAGSQEFFKVLADHLDDQISKGVLGQTASSSGTPGKLGDEKLQAEVRDDIRDDDAEQLEETINRDLVKPYIDLNFGPQENYPVVQLRAPKAEDIKALSSALKDLVPLGLRVEQSVVRDRIGLPDPDPKAKPEDLLGVIQVRGTGSEERGQALNRQMMALNREGSEPDIADQFAAQLSDQAGPAMDQMIETIRELIDTAGSLEEIREKLVGLYDQMDATQLGEIMMYAMTAGNLAGRVEVADGD
jgi:phage gp29-like protein